MRIYVDITEVRDCRDKVVAAFPKADVEVSPSEGYDILEVARFEERLREWLQEHFPQPKGNGQ